MLNIKSRVYENYKMFKKKVEIVTFKKQKQRIREKFSN